MVTLMPTTLVYKFFAGSGSTVNAVSGDIAFETANGVLSGKIDSKGQIGSITVDKTKLDSKFLTVSAPVRDLLKTAIMNQGGVIDKGQIGGKFLSQVAITSLILAVLLLMLQLTLQLMLVHSRLL